jgi:type IV fimbrial biogenesis protein FimT
LVLAEVSRTRTPPYRSTRARGGPRLARGFTLIETLVVVTIVVILTMVAAPSFQSIYLGNKLAAFTNDFVASAQVARSEAIKRNQVVRVCRSADGASCASSGTWQQGWIVFADTNNNGSVDSGETIIRTEPALSSDYLFQCPTNVTCTGSNYSLAFQANGVGSDTASLMLCRALPSAGSQERSIALGPTGRTTITKTKTGHCPSP